MPRAKKNFGSSNSKIVEVSQIYKTDLYWLIFLVQAFQDQLPKSRRQFHELYMLLSQVSNKLKVKGLLKPVEPRPIPNPIPAMT